ncbi:MAG: DnaD domain protein [Clostridia bacterium]|nr:DnaD domain protein [Clostridia bacterium]
MNDFVFIKEKPKAEETPLENEFISRFMPQAPEFAVKAYLYGLMLVSCPGRYEEDIAAVLGCTKEDILSAFSYWQAQGLVKIVSDEPVGVRYLGVSAALASPVPEGGARFGEFVSKLQSVLGTRVLTGQELSKVYDWVEVFGFEQEAAVLIVKHFLDKKGAKTSVSYMDSAAASIASKGCLTAESVKEYFESEALLESGAGRILKRWNRRRPPTEDEIALYEKWTEAWGFDEKAIDAACVEVTAGDKPSFKYLDSILTRWHEKGAVSGEEVTALLKEDDMIAELARQAFERAGIKHRASAEERLVFAQWHKEWCMSAELILCAADYSRLDPRPFASMKRLLNGWHEEGVSSVSAAARSYEAGNSSRPASKNARALNYIRGCKYSDDELKKLGVSLGEEFYSDEEQ